MTRLRFLQISDVHLDSTLSGGRLRLPPDKAERRRRELRQVFADALELGRERRVDVVLIPGDLFDDESVSADTVNFVIDALGREPRLPVVLAPGNHDHYSLASPYCPELREARGLPPWPSNVRIVSRTRFHAFRHADLLDVSFTAMAHDHDRPREDRLLANPLPRQDAPLQLLLLHGSRDRFLPPGKMLTLPFSDDELAGQGFHYAALGHYHSQAAIEHGGRILGCYAGCPAGRSLDERGPKSVLLGEVLRDGERLEVSIEPVRLDRRVVDRVTVRVQGVTHRDALLERIDGALQASGQPPEAMLLVEVIGRLPPGIDPRLPEEFLEDRYFHLAFDTSALRPDYDIEAHLRRGLGTTEGRFVREMQARIDSESDPAERRMLESALYYGLDALLQKEVRPRYED